jgi:tRNA U34 5-carboxymethylaminomethyl modifying GTPase MnmE/TrmE
MRGRDRGQAEQKVILTERHQDLLAREQEIIARLMTALETFPATDEDLASLEYAAHQLGEMFLLVIVGEFNSGKSAFINALVGEEVMPEGVTPTTAVINLLRHGDEQTETMLPDGIIQRTFPAEFLRLSIPPAPTRSSGSTRHLPRVSCRAPIWSSS